MFHALWHFIQTRLAHRGHWSIALLIRLILGWIFITSGWAKLEHLELFESAVDAYGILPPSLVPVVSYSLPWLEIMAGVYVALGLFTRYAAGVLAAMLIVFIVAISWALITGADIACGCLVGGKAEPVSIKKVVEDVLLLAGALYLMLKSVPALGPLTLDRFLK